MPQHKAETLSSREHSSFPLQLSRLSNLRVGRIVNGEQGFKEVDQEGWSPCRQQGGNVTPMEVSLKHCRRPLPQYTDQLKDLIRRLKNAPSLQLYTKEASGWQQWAVKYSLSLSSNTREGSPEVKREENKQVHYRNVKPSPTATINIKYSPLLAT